MKNKLTPYEITFKRGIKRRRIELGLSVIQCAAKMKGHISSRHTWNSWETEGANASMPSIAMLPHIAKVLQLDSPMDLIPAKADTGVRRKKKSAKRKLTTTREK